LRGGGMMAVVTDIGILEPNSEGEMILAWLHPSRTADEARANTGWDLKVASEIKVSAPVTERELVILRSELDPQGTYLRTGQ
jgi:glutaconate CoA-transferase subunit B